MESQLVEFLRQHFVDADTIEIEALAPIPGGFSRETYRFDAVISTSSGRRVVPLILRKDPPPAAALLDSDRLVEHTLIEALRTRTQIPVSRSLGAIMDPAVLGAPAMIVERAPGSGATSDLFHDGPDADQAEAVVTHLCESLALLHTTDPATIDVAGLGDPRGVGIDTSSWDRYMDTTFEYYVAAWRDLYYDPSQVFLLDLFLTLRRRRPRPLPLAVVHGDFNPANFLYHQGRVSAIIDWENARIGDPREDLGWMVTMDMLSNTSIMEHPRSRGGFLAFYNELTGFGVTSDEIDYFTLFGTANVGVPVAAAIRRRVAGEHTQFLHLYMAQSSLPAAPNLARMLGYPGVS